MNKKNIRLFLGALAIAVGLQCYSQIWKTYTFIAKQQQAKQDIAQLTSQLALLKQDKKIMVPYELMYEMTSICSPETYKDLLYDLDHCNAYTFFKQAKISEPAYHTLKFALQDEEMSFRHRLNIYRWNTRGKTNIRFYSDNIAQQQRFGMKSIKDFIPEGGYIVCAKDFDLIKHSRAKVLFQTQYYILYKNEI